MGYYVYELVILPDQKVCYVGKGKGNRLNDHLRRAKRPEFKCGQKRLYRRIREVLATGKTIEGRIVFETNDEMLALKEEARRIREYGFDSLFNVASHAFLGRTLKPEVRKDIAAASRRMWADPSYRNKNHTVKGKRFAYRPKLALRKPKNYPIGKFGKGVYCWRSRGMTRFQARIQRNGKSVSLGYFKTSTEAAISYDNAFEKEYGKRPNNT